MWYFTSPIEIYESLNCHGKRVEEMTAEECTKCQMEITTYTFTTVPDLLQWADGKVNVMFCVKQSSDIPRAISSLVENNATHRSFLEVGISSIIEQEVNATPGWDQVYYVVNMKSHDEFEKYVECIVFATVCFIIVELIFVTLQGVNRLAHRAVSRVLIGIQ